jgi:type IV secretory pathway VirD2 relaxase
MVNERQPAAAVRPRIGGRRGQVSPQRVPTFRAGLLARLQQRFARGYRATSSALGGSARRVPPSTDVGEPGPRSRRCVVKARIVQMDDRGTAAARLHLEYIVRDGVEPDGSKGAVFGRDEGDARADLHATIESEKRQFRFIVSPEDRDIDLRWFTRALMRQVEADLGRELIWGAVTHHDTDNPHVHVVVRGVDRQGRDVRIDRDYISRRMRWRAQELATRELGPRSLADIRRQRDREVDQERFTTLDRDLERRGDKRVDLAMLRTASPEQRTRLVGRLRVLEELALARREGFGDWALVPGWQEALRALGQRGDIIKRIHAALPVPSHPTQQRVIDGKTEQPPIEGVLRRKGLHDELPGDMYAVIEDHQGTAHYVRVDARTAAQVPEGAIVRASVVRDTWAKRMDEALVATSADGGGIYDPAAHLAALRRRPVSIGDRTVPAADVVAANLRRLERLGRHNLVHPLPNGRWRVPADLVARLRARDQTHPRMRVRLEQVGPPLAVQASDRGPAWVDGVAPLAPFGFAAEIRRAQTQRAAALDVPQRAVPSAGGVRDRSPAAEERRAAGEQAARERRMVFIDDAPSGFRGVAVVYTGKDGRQHVALIDHASRRLAMAPADTPPSAHGKVWVVGRRPDGTCFLRQRDLSRDS